MPTKLSIYDRKCHSINKAYRYDFYVKNCIDGRTDGRADVVICRDRLTSKKNACFSNTRNSVSTKLKSSPITQCQWARRQRRGWSRRGWRRRRPGPRRPGPAGWPGSASPQGTCPPAQSPNQQLPCRRKRNKIKKVSRCATCSSGKITTTCCCRCDGQKDGRRSENRKKR